MEGKFNQEAFIKISTLAIIVLSVFVASVLGFGFFQYKEISRTLAHSEQFTELGEYEQAIQELKSISDIWLLDSLGVKEREISDKIQENEQFIEDEENYKQGIEAFDNENWDEAKELLSKVSNDYSQYEDAKRKIAQSEEKILEKKIEEESASIREDAEKKIEEVRKEAEEARKETEEKFQQEQVELEAKLEEQQEEVEKKYAIVNTDLLGLSDHQVIDNISIRSEVKIIEEEDEWTHVEFNNKEGWVWSDDLSDDSSDVLDLSGIIRQWKPIVGSVRCEFRYSDTGTLYGESFGSGIVLDPSNNPISVITNKHIITDEEGYYASFCDVLFPERDYLYEGEWEDLFEFASGEDGAYIDINNTDKYIRDLTSDFPMACQQKPSEGDEVIILGYPGIGSREGITVTRGIISGFEGNYYITDAKIDQGNSGGAAILVKNNCLLGIPTYAISGEVESLGRILDISAFLE